MISPVACMGGIPLLVLTDEQKILNASSAAGCEAHVKSTQEYLAALRDGSIVDLLEQLAAAKEC